MTFGWAGKTVWVDLSRAKISIKPLDMNLARNYIGGRGINSRMLYDMVGPNVDALSPENVLLISVGPLTGTIVPGNGGRTTVTAKSPLTDIHGDSNFGGFFGPEIKFAGYDQIVFLGRADHPVYLFIDGDSVELKDASYLWGKTTWETQEILREEHRDRLLQCICIGPAGENLVRFASIIHGLKRAAGRTGMGAVMGSKNLKAVAVRGDKGIKIANDEKFEELCIRWFYEITGNPYFRVRSRYGTPLLMEHLNLIGALNTRNYQTGRFEFAEAIGGEKLKEDYSVKMVGCFGCPAHCTHYYLIKDGLYAGTCGEGPDFVVTGMLGSKCGIGELDVLLKMNNLVNQYGLDAGSCGSMIAWAMDCYERGILGEEETDGLALHWGDTEAAIQLIHKIARREGFGNTLAEGEKRAPAIVGKGSEKYMYHVKGMSFVPEDPRGEKLFGFQYAVATRGGDHLRGDAFLASAALVDYAEKLFNERQAANPLSPVAKGIALKWFEDYCAAIDSCGVCKFVFLQFCNLPDSPNVLAGMLSSATGMEIGGGNELMRIGERIYNVEKAFNVREGLTRKDDMLPEKFLKEPLDTTKTVIELEHILDEYYYARGWDIKYGLQTTKKLEELGLNDIADELGRLGKLVEA